MQTDVGSDSASSTSSRGSQNPDIDKVPLIKKCKCDKFSKKYTGTCSKAKSWIKLKYKEEDFSYI